MRRVKNLFLFLFLFLLLSCERTFDYSIYSAKVEENDKNTRKSNFDKLKVIESELNDSSTFTVALISDSHTYYDDLDDAVHAINSDRDISFLIHGGDMTDGGILAEYYIFRNIMMNLNPPFFSVIGNHDCLANGRRIYQDMFGIENYSFVFSGCKFVFFNDVVWEMGYKEPDFLWLKEELNDGISYRHKFVITHIPPWDMQFTPLYNAAYTKIVDTSNTCMSIHGHLHNHEYPTYSNHKDPEYLVIGSPSKRMFVKMEVSTDTVIVQNIKF